MRKPLIVANWKMHKNMVETHSYFIRLAPLLAGGKELPEVVVCPPFTSLSQAAASTADTPLKLGAQNMFWEEKGSYTGEISPLMLRECSCRYVILGHSERRQILHESSRIINQKIHAAFKADLIPIFCVGETWQERRDNRTREVLKDQLTRGLEEIRHKIEQLVIAYEPVWAIGSGNHASPGDAQKIALFLRETLASMFNPGAAAAIRILYGGSVTKENIAGFMQQPDVDGALVGGASLEAEEFSRIVRFDN